MPEDIQASDSEFSTAVSIFYVTYVLFEAPWAVLMKKLTPRNILTGLCIVWSLTTIFTGFIQSVRSLYATRLILGACEAGLFPCLNLYLTMVYRREEQAKRVSYLMSCAAISGAVGGLLAYGLLQMDGIGGKEGWRYEIAEDGIKSMGSWLTAVQMGVYHRRPVQHRLCHFDLVWLAQQPGRGIFPLQRGEMDDARAQRAAPQVYGQ